VWHGRGCHQVEFEHERFGADCFDLLANLTQFLSATSRKDDSSEVASDRSAVALPPIPELASVTIATDFDIFFSCGFESVRSQASAALSLN
jgi:hypothetical protein